MDFFAFCAFLKASDTKTPLLAVLRTAGILWEVVGKALDVVELPKPGSVLKEFTGAAPLLSGLGPRSFKTTPLFTFSQLFDIGHFKRSFNSVQPCIQIFQP